MQTVLNTILQACSLESLCTCST